MAEINSITDDMLKALPKPEKNVEFSIPQHKGLRVKHYTSGSMSFLWIYRFEGKQRKLVLGKFAYGMRIENAVREMDKAKAVVKAGHDPQQPQDEKIRTVEQLAKAYYKKNDPDGWVLIQQGKEPLQTSTTGKWKAPRQIWRIINADIIAHLGRLELNSVTTPMVNKLIQGKVTGTGAYADRDPAPAFAGRVLSTLNGIFKMGRIDGHMNHNPLDGITPTDLGVKIGMRDRHIPAGEMPKVWAAFGDENPRTALAFKILLLTGVRAGELTRAKWENVDLEAKTWTIPPEHQKSAHKVSNPRDFLVPLTPKALAAFEALHALTGHQESALLSDKLGNRPFPHGGLRRRAARIAKDLKIDHFSPHDLRRTFRTMLAEAGVQFHIAERCIGHSLGKLAETYDRSDMLEHRREAHQKVEDLLDVYLDTSGKVARLERSA